MRSLGITRWLSNSLITKVSKIYEGDDSGTMLSSYTFSVLTSQTLVKPFVPRSDSPVAPICIITVWKGTLHPQPDFLLSPSFHNHLQLSCCSSSAQPTFHRPPLQYFRKFCTKVSNDFKLPNIVDKVLVFILPLWYSRHWQNVSQEHYVPLTPEYQCSLKCQHNFQ